MPRLIGEISFISNLHLLESDAKISKSSRAIRESHCNSWSDIADFLAFLIRFLVRFLIFSLSSHVPRHFSKKMLEHFSLIINLAVTTCIAVDLSRENVFLEGIFESKQVTKPAVDLKRTNGMVKSLRNGIFVPIVCINRAVKSNEDLPVSENDEVLL